MMRQTPYQGWTIFARNSRTEWPIAHCVRYTRRDAIGAFKDGFPTPEIADRIFAKWIKDGSIRVGKVIVRAPEGGE